MKITTRNRITGGLFLLFGLFMFFESNKIAARMTKDIGSGFFPKVVSVAIIAVALAVIALSFLKKSDDLVKKENLSQFGGWATISLLVLYVAVLNRIGFIISTIIYLFIQMYLLSTDENRNWWVMAIFSVISPIVIYLFFVYLLKMPLPKGLINF